MEDSLKTVNDSKFNTYFKEVPHDQTLGVNAREQLRLFCLKNVTDKHFSMENLRDFIAKNIGQYVFSRGQLLEYEDEGNQYSVGMDALDRMHEAGGADEKDFGTELGEILLYAFLEAVLNAPKIYSKIELNTTVRNNTSTSESMHLLEIGGDEETLSYEMVFGSSSMIGDLGLAVDDAFEHVKAIRDSQDTEIKIVDRAIFDLPANDPMNAQIKKIITPDDGKEVTRDTAYGLFLGYTLGIEREGKTKEEYRNLVDQFMQADIKLYAPHIIEKINELGLNDSSFYVYVMPFDDVEKDKKTIMKKIMREGD